MEAVTIPGGGARPGTASEAGAMPALLPLRGAVAEVVALRIC